MTLLSCQPKEQIPIVQNIDSNWRFTSANTSDWYPATVPGNVFTDLLNNKLIENPFIKANEEKVQWVSDSSWIYKTTVKVPQKTLLKKHIELNFTGLDTYAKIYLNDQLILTSNNAFRQYKVDVKSILKKENKLKIEFESTAITEEREKEKLEYTLPEGHRIFTRKAQFQYGWDWGPKINTSGIWKDLFIKAWDDAIITDVYIKQGKISKEKAILLNSITVTNIEKENAQLTVSIGGKQFAKLTRLKKGTHTYTIPVSIENPQLWWPHNLGLPHLYDIEFEIVYDDKVLDRKKIKHGIRTIELVTEKDSIGTSFYFTVNDIPVYAKGANYIPQNSFQNNVTPKHYENLLNDVVSANMNMLRVWGGGIYENDIFYDLCDEKGILVWQDFMFACAMYPGDKSFLENVQQEANDQVKRLRNHASIALWAGNNENSEGWHRWGWQSGRSEEEKAKIWSHYLKVFDSILPNTVNKLTQTSYWESSPSYGRGNPKYKTEGDAHDWWVWHDAYPFEHFEKNVPRFMSEFGFQSFPSIETINYINQKDTVDIHTDAIKSHQKHSRGFQLIKQYMKRDYPVPTSDKDYIYISQLVQAKGITMGIEAQRRSRPYSMGSLYWQLNDCWPVISWSSIDFFGNWKALHYKAQKSFKNLLISSHIKNNRLTIFLVNDHLRDFTDTLSIKVIDFYGRELWSSDQKVTALKNSSTNVFELSLDQLNLNPQEVVIMTSFREESSNFYLEKPKNLLLPKEHITIENIRKVNGGFEIQLSSTTFQKEVFLFTKKKGHFSDNFFDLFPNTSTTIFFKTDTDSLDDVTIQSLNTMLP
jgi:beta-mannosidase